MPTEIPRDEEESDKDMQGRVDSSDNNNNAYARPDEREETVQVGDAQSARFSALTQAHEASEEPPRIRHLSIPSSARSDC